MRNELKGGECELKSMKILSLALVSLGMVFGVAFAAHHTPEERGKTLFNDAYFASGSRACSDCHPGGKGLEKAGSRADLEAMVNNCIVKANGGTAIDPNSGEMKDIIAFIKSLKK